jgi:DNA polymerase I-like protein with 3'-5' exonuclease and polymerase domains
VAFDFSQLEMRIAAYWSGDPTMMAACEATDMHAANAALIWPDEFRTKEEDKEVYKKLRDMAKQCGFAIAYGAGALTVLGRIIAMVSPPRSSRSRRCSARCASSSKRTTHSRTIS